jgi:ABC-2 type transport system ATP-binding protein
MIQVENVDKSFEGFQALDHANMHVPKGAIYGLVGPNGAGKSTIIRHLTGIFKPDAGTITIDGQPVYENIAVKENIAYIPDDFFYFMQANTLEMMRFYKGLYPHFSETLFHELKEYFPAINVKTNIRRLSKGMQKQVAFWLSVCCNPKLLILDEPVDGLDPVMRRQIWSILMSRVADQEMTVLVSSHNLRELEDVCDHVGIMHQGKVILEKSLSDLQGNVSKVQMAFEGELPPLPDKFQILHQASAGRVHTLIVRGDQFEVREELEKLHPMLLDLLPLSLEEIFIYELGGAEYAVKDIIL